MRSKTMLAAIAGLGLLSVGLDTWNNDAGYGKRHRYNGKTGGHLSWGSNLTPKQRKARKKSKNGSKARQKMYKAA